MVFRRIHIPEVLAEVASHATDGALIVALKAEGAEITVVVGDPTGTVLVYFPPGYAETATDSLLSVGDVRAAEADLWSPPLVADYFGHYTAFPRWSVIPSVRDGCAGAHGVL